MRRRRRWAARSVSAYPAYEIIFCVSDAADPVVPLVERLIAANPGRPARLLVGYEPLFVQPEARQLCQGLGGRTTRLDRHGGQQPPAAVGLPRPDHGPRRAGPASSRPRRSAVMHGQFLGGGRGGHPQHLSGAHPVRGGRVRPGLRAGQDARPASLPAGPRRRISGAGRGASGGCCGDKSHPPSRVTRSAGAAALLSAPWHEIGPISMGPTGPLGAVTPCDIPVALRA